MTTHPSSDSQEREDLLATLATQRGFLRHTVKDITDDQARKQTTVSELCLGGLIKHVSQVEKTWVNFIIEGPSAIGGFDAKAMASHQDGFRMLEGETLEGLLAEYEDVARRTEDVVSEVSSLDASHPLPEAPWFKPGATWTMRRAIVHILAETAQHAGHADVIREALDGSKTMG